MILLGPPGTGKTHIATALGIRACLAGQRVLFATEKPGTGSAKDPKTGRDFDDLKPVLEELLRPEDQKAVFTDNALALYKTALGTWKRAAA